MSLIIDPRETCQICDKSYIGEGIKEDLCAMCFVAVVYYQITETGRIPTLYRGYYTDNPDVVVSFLENFDEIEEREINKTLRHMGEDK